MRCAVTCVFVPFSSLLVTAMPSSQQSWIMFAIITVEVLIKIKFGWDIIITPVATLVLPNCMGCSVGSHFYLGGMEIHRAFQRNAHHWTILPKVHFEKGGLSSNVGTEV